MLEAGHYIDKIKTAGLESYYWKDEIISMVTANKFFCEKEREKRVWLKPELLNLSPKWKKMKTEKNDMTKIQHM